MMTDEQVAKLRTFDCALDVSPSTCLETHDDPSEWCIRCGHNALLAEVKALIQKIKCLQKELVNEKQLEETETDR